MPNRLIRNTAVLLKIETTYGVDAAPAGAADAMLVSDLSINPINAQNVDRDLIRPFLGGSEQLLGTRYVEVGFSVEATGPGTVAVAAPWSAALRACATAGAATASVRYDHTLVSTGMDSVTIDWHDDGVRHKILGCRGNAKFSFPVGGKPKIEFSFIGLYTTPVAVGNPAVTLTAWKAPETVGDANSGDVTFGATHATGTAPALTSGTTYPSQGLEIDLGNSVNFTALLGGETVDITQRSVTGRVTLDLTAAQEVSMMTAVEQATLQSVGLVHGTRANQKMLLWMPAVQLINPQKAEVNGKRLVSFDLRALPVTGNDELRVVTSF